MHSGDSLHTERLLEGTGGTRVGKARSQQALKGGEHGGDLQAPATLSLSVYSESQPGERVRAQSSKQVSCSEKAEAGVHALLK